MVNLSSSDPGISPPEPMPSAVRQRMVGTVAKALGRQHPDGDPDGLDIRRLAEVVCDGPGPGDSGELDTEAARRPLLLVAWGFDPECCRARLAESPLPAVMEGAGLLLKAFSDALSSTLSPLAGEPLLEIAGTWIGLVSPRDCGEVELRLRRLAARLLPDLPLYTARIDTCAAELSRDSVATLRRALVVARRSRLDAGGSPFVEAPGLVARCSACGLRPAESHDSEAEAPVPLCFVCRARVSVAASGSMGRGQEGSDHACSAVTLRLVGVGAALAGNTDLASALWGVEQLESALDAGVRQQVSRFADATGQLTVVRPIWGERVIVGYVPAGAANLAAAAAGEVRKRLAASCSQPPSLGVGLAWSASGRSRHAAVGRSLDLAGLAGLDAEPGGCRVDFEVETPELRNLGLGHPLQGRSVLEVPGPDGRPERVRLTQRPVSLGAFEAMAARTALTRRSALALSRCLASLELEGRAGVVSELLATLSGASQPSASGRGSPTGRAVHRWLETGHSLTPGAAERINQLLFRQERQALDADYSCGLVDELELSQAATVSTSGRRPRGQGGQRGRGQRKRSGGGRPSGGVV